MPPRFTISRTILWQGAWMLIPGAVCYALMKPSQSPEALERELRSTYGRNVRDAQAKRGDMQKFFDHMKSGAAPASAARERARPPDAPSTAARPPRPAQATTRSRRKKWRARSRTGPRR